ncbi:amidohydrolase family protein [Rhodococcus qingshengii]|uniref:amidohydrolase family protein n=1 Tax=Rhodococcus qingshengii TaxID=334542 RepID=UPI0010A670B4|nr:amidohydrolase family protein [Rhodococcus qingshengii]THJ66128.1 hypothetical protein EU244_28275 [Rhodococcus qingshengii]
MLVENELRNPPLHIDTHAHVILPSTIRKTGRYGPDIVTNEQGRSSIRLGPYESRVGGEKGMTLEEFKAMGGDPLLRIKELDSLGIDAMGVTISPLFYLYWAEDDARIPFASIQNDAFATNCNTDPSRLFWMATLPLPNIEASIAEVLRSVALGARGINVGTGDFDGVELDDERLWPLYAEIEAAGLPLLGINQEASERSLKPPCRELPAPLRKNNTGGWPPDAACASGGHSF